MLRAKKEKTYGIEHGISDDTKDLEYPLQKAVDIMGGSNQQLLPFCGHSHVLSAVDTVSFPTFGIDRAVIGISSVEAGFVRVVVHRAGSPVVLFKVMLSLLGDGGEHFRDGFTNTAIQHIVLERLRQGTHATLKCQRLNVDHSECRKETTSQVTD